jgi:hypothetical protein
MVKKWGILQHPLTNKLGHVKYIVTAVAILHNFCINERLAREEVGNVHTPKNYELSPFQDALRLTAAQFECNEITTLLERNHSLNRLRMVDIVVSMGLTRPGKQTRKRKRNSEESQ